MTGTSKGLSHALHASEFKAFIWTLSWKSEVEVRSRIMLKHVERFTLVEVDCQNMQLKRIYRYKKSYMQSSHVTRFKDVYTDLQFQSLLAMIIQWQCLCPCQSGHKSKCPWFLQLCGMLDILDYPGRDMRLGWARKRVWEGLDMTEPSFTIFYISVFCLNCCNLRHARCFHWPRLLWMAKT